MPVLALGSERKVRFPRFTNFRVQNTAVSMVIQNVFVGSDFSARRGFEAYRELPSSFVPVDAGNFIGNLDGLKPHGVVVSSGTLVFLENLGIHRSKKVRVNSSRNVESRVSKVVSWVWLVQGVKSYNPWVCGKLF
jgi:hypothetical protein